MKMRYFLQALIILVLLSISPVQSAGFDNGFISFAVTELVVNEDSSNSLYTTISIPFIREVGSQKQVLASFQVINSSATGEFLSTSNNVVFQEGQTESVASLVIINDATPELNKTYIVRIVNAINGAEIGSVSTLLLTISASDDPFGRLEFAATSLAVSGSEPLASQNITVEFEVIRNGGVHGQITVDYEVLAGPNSPSLDVTPTQNQLTFNDQLNSSTFTLFILADNIPENDEIFRVRLTNPTGGAVISSTNNEAQLTILSNDSPVRLSTSLLEVSESDGTAKLTVYRGISQDGNPVGPTGQTTTVQYATSAGTATPGEDFTSASGIITFLPGITSQIISIPVIDDTSPEGDETFTVTLSSVSSDSVLQSPVTATVNIVINDNAGGLISFASTNPQTINEDSQTTATFTIQRMLSTIGNITVAYSIKDINNHLATGDFTPASSTIIIPDGVNQTTITVRAIDDSIAEEAERFTVSIDSIQSGAGELGNETVRVATLFVADSDDVYGIINTNGGQIALNSGQREFNFQITRSVSSVRDVTVEYHTLYLPPGVTDLSLGESGTVAAATGSVQLLSGQTSKDVSTSIFSSGFIEEGGMMYVEITDTELSAEDTLLVNPPSSPRLGSSPNTSASVPFASANGYISFSPGSLSHDITEPDSGLSSLTLTVIRTGGFGTATITWIASSVVDSTFSFSDIASSVAQVTIPNGASSNSFDIMVLADDVPELNETFNVLLLSVAQAGQRIASANMAAVITILENDNPEGTFFIFNQSLTPFLIEENDLATLVITVERTGGNLTAENIMFGITPSNTNDFIGGAGIIEFPVGSSSKNIFLTPLLDDIPEINETFTLTISSTKQIIGSPSNVSITILANDDYNGVFNFTPSSMSLTIDEPANPGYVNTSLVTAANFTIQRNVASFGPSTVYWEVDHSAGNDVTPLNGSVNFADGVIYGSFQISSTSDFETELSRTHTIHLVSVDGGGRISNDLISDTASLTITQNDDPISIATADLYQTDAEGQMVNISVIRGGKRYGPVDVGFNVTYVTASADDAVVTPSPNIVRFQDGEQSKSLTVSIANDDLPELNEQLSIHLTSVIGDAVLAASNIEATLIIEASDDPNGIFQFANASLNRVADEGTNVTLVVERLRGSYQRIEVYWRALYLNTSTGLTTPAVSQIDLGVVAGTIVFENHERMKSFDVIILDDGVPELEEMYVIELVNTTGGLTGGLINTDNESVTISIRENESPYGVFMIESTDPVWLAEDIPLGDSANGTGTVDVVRTAGVFNTIQAVWEILPPNVSLPSFTDLLLKGSVGSGVTMVTPRPSTSTRALGFGGSSSSLVTVPSHLHPSDIHDGSFSISLWAVFNSSVNGMMLAKASSDGSTISYGLAVIADINQYIFRLYYLPATLNSGFSTAEVSVPQSSLSSDSWHYIVISIASTSVSFYVDGSLVGQRTLVSSISSDGVGMALTVGGLANSQYFIGSLQDVRIYGSPLTQQYISAVYSNLAANEFLYVSGEVSVGAGNSQNSFNIQTRDDSIPEQTAIYVIHLVAVSGKAQLSDSSISMDIAVLKSDSSNGVFSLSGVAPVPVDEGGNITVMVSRAVSTYGIVSVQWEVRTASSGLLASDDFDPATGSAMFYDGDTEMDFVLQTVNETVPELQEGFVVTLVAVAVDDIYPSTTPTSGAWLNSSSVNANISITENDYPYGVFQLASAYPPAGIIPPVIEVPQVHVDESAGIITLYIVRAQGTVGSATVDYSTQDGTAISGGVTPDYVPTGGTLSYGDGEQVKTINVTIRDDSVPEIGKYFYINLTNPIGSDGAPVLGTGKDMVVNINPSDDAFGVFGFTVDSLSQVVREQPSGTVVPYIVSRGNKGTFGDVTVYWEVVNGGNDVTQATGTIFFREGITSASFLVTVLNDPDPELHENFTVRLVNATNGGRIADDGTQIAILTIQANDFPYGVFTFSSGFRPLTISESAGSINIIISREFGMSGTVVVYYATADGPAGDSYATAGEDYVQTAGNVTFQPNQTIGVFSLTINEDTTPEIPETFYVTLFNATLLSEPDIHLQNQELPTISNGSATIIISENDNAEGIFQFNSSTFTAVEGDSTAILISRTAGTYGEVSLSWRIGLLTASSADVSALEGTDIVPNGVTLYPLNVTITDDDIPEFEETFTIAITSVGASIGAPILATVTIPTNDDPHGAIVFATDSILVSVPEPESGFSSVVLNVTREGGSIGLVFVDYNVTSANGDPVSSDISFDAVSDLYFTNGLTDRSLTIRILSDDIPEVTEVFYVNLFGATGGSRVGDAGRAEIRILANDKPYGSSVSLADRNIVTTEPDDSDASQVNVTLTRTGGILDDLIVYYTVRSAVPDALDLFLSAIDSVSPPDAQKLQEITVFVTDDRLNECAVSCVLAYTLCQSFVYNPSTSYCQLYSSTISEAGSIPQAGVSYYQAIPGQLRSLAFNIASAGEDFEYVLNGNVTISRGSADGYVPVIIYSDDFPELSENLTLELTRVEVAGVTDLSLLPAIQNGVAEIAIAENDYPYGLFSISVGGEQAIRVQEYNNTLVSMTIEREGGSVGAVNVSWSTASLTATLGSDYTADDVGVIEFDDGDTTRSVTLSVLDDSLPEADELIRVSLSSPTGGAVLSSRDHVNVTIESNDDAAGVISLASGSRAASIREGEEFTLIVDRNGGLLGRIMVNWTITATSNSTNNNNNNIGNITNQTFPDNQAIGPETQFQTASGFIIFEEGINQGSITTRAIDDDVPEVQEPYHLTLTSATSLTTGVKRPVIDPNGNRAIITIRTSDNPYGIVEFANFMLSYTTEEDVPVGLNIVRLSGGVNGAVRVFFQAKSANQSMGTLATPGVDFNDTVMSVTMDEGESSAIFNFPVIDDDIPETSEVFIIEIISASLESDPSISVPLGSFTTVSVTISENDEPNGIFVFEAPVLTVSEDAGMIDVIVRRVGGTFGNSVVTLQGIAITADTNADFILETSALMFSDSMSSANVSLTIIDDPDPEPDETFSINILSVSNGVIGTVNSITITISSNDYLNGLFSFTDSSLTASVTEATDIPTNENTVTLMVQRLFGDVGDVSMSYSVEPAGQFDLSPTSGILTFPSGVNEQTFILTAVSDNNPELDETYAITLGTPTNGGELDSANVTSYVTILANQNPYGMIELYIANDLTSTSVEENVGNVRLELRRSFPSFDTMSATLMIIDDSVSNNESIPDYSPILTPILIGANETSVYVDLAIIDDDIPELDETFIVQLVNVSGGAVIGSQNETSVTILSNDDAYGLIGFTDLSVIIDENSFMSQFIINVERNGGTFGNVTVAWEIGGAHSIGEITPSNGTISFAEGQNSTSILFAILFDNDPELDEISTVNLTSVTGNGVPMGGDQSRGATIDSNRRVSYVTVLANDDIFGTVVLPNFLGTQATEEDGLSIAMITVMRVFGNRGNISITYRTTEDIFATETERAIAGLDYVNVTSGIVYMGDRETTTTIPITILPDNIPELGEFFIVQLTNVTLVNPSLSTNPSELPRVSFEENQARVQISQNDFPQGLLSFMTGPVIVVNENDGTVCIPVSRSGGLFGTVGATYTFQDGSATGSDYADIPGTVLIGPQITSGCINVTITNDLLAESDENFTVSLSNPINGVMIDTDNFTVTIIILENDDNNGVFSFASDSVVQVIPEGDAGTFTVSRSGGSVGSSVVYWLVDGSGHADLHPVIGNVTFNDGDDQISFTIEAISDNLPELYEVHTVRLVGLMGVGRLNNPLVASVAIPASDDPAGIVSFETYPLNTVIIQEGSSFTFTLVRRAGLFGSVAVQWSISPSDSNAFSLTSGSISFAENQNTSTFIIQTLPDSISEVATQYTISLVGTGDARVDTNASSVTIIIPASDNIHGVVGFPSLSTSVSESVGSLEISVTRTGGVEGDVLVNFTVSDNGASSPSDYYVNNSYIIISDGSNSGTITAYIIDDSLPEINELFTVTLTSVTLINYANGGRNFDFAGDISLIDSLPTLSTNAQFQVTISSNDDAYGIISLSTDTYQVNEGSSVVINVTRSGGLFGTISVAFSIASGTALGNGIDYISPSSPMGMVQDQSSLLIIVPTVNDVTPELQEYFTFTITVVEGGATLGTITSATIIILPSDNPNGRLTFTTQDVAGRTIANPTTGFTDVMLEVLRLDGTDGIIDVTWEVTGPDPGMERDDILQSTLQGVLTFNDQQTNNFITITVLASDGPEPEENFTITLTAATKGAVIDQTGDSALLTISQRGLPFGVIGFYGQALSIQNAYESTNLSLPLIRSEGTFGVSQVFFTVSGPTPSLDVSPITGSVTFNEGESFAYISLYIVEDDLPELDELYTVTLTSIAGKATLASSDTLTSTFKIIANDSPYGTFGISDFLLQLVYSDEDIVRRLSFTIVRGFGSQGTVDMVISIVYNEEPDAGYFPSNITRTFIHGQDSISVTIDSTPNAFLAAGSILNVSVISVNLTSGHEPGSVVLPEISPLTGVIAHNISENVSNPSVGFTSNMTSVIDGQVADNVQLVVQRFGLEGNVQVTWSAGYYLPSVANGTLTPSAGTFFMAASTKQHSVNFTATPTDPPGSPEIFSLTLAVETLSPLVARVREETGTVFIESWGLVKLTHSSYSAIEGQTIRIAVSRLYGSIGDIEVLGVAKAPSPVDVPANETAADPIIDYPLTTLSVTLNEGVTSGDILIVLPYNTGVNPLKVFAFSLIGVRRLNQKGTFTTPRLSLPTEDAVITIIDAEGGAGRFGFKMPTISIQEAGSPLARAIIVRENGSVGVVSVQLMIEETRADGTTPGNEIASAADGDYDPQSMATMVTFGNGETEKSVTVQILNDDIPETNEYFTIKLLNPQGGKALINPDKSTFEVNIIANDDQEGVFSLVTTSLTLDQDSSPSGVLTIRRTGGLFGAVTINWQTSYTDSASHAVPLGALLVEDASSVTFLSGQAEANITLQLAQNSVPAGGETFTLRIFSFTAGVTFANTMATITAIPSDTSTYQFRSDSRMVVATGLSTDLTIQRISGVKLSSQVRYSTSEPLDSIIIGKLTFAPAMASVHFTSVDAVNVIFNVDVGDVTIPITIISTDTVPRAFYVNIEATNNDNVQNSQAIIVINPAGTVTDLYRGYFNAFQATTSDGLNSVATDIKTKLTNSQITGTNQLLMKYILEEIISTVTASGSGYPLPLQSVMADIFDIIIRNDTFSGQLRFEATLKSFAHSLVTGRSCDQISVTISEPSYIINSTRYLPDTLQSLSFYGRGNDYIQLSSSAAEINADCVNVHFIEYTDPSLYITPLFGSKVMVLSLQDPLLSRLNTPIIYRVHSVDGSLILPSDNNCLIWRYPTSDNEAGYWNQSCTTSQQSIIELNYIECQCNLVGDFAISIPPGYGWTIPGPISCGFVSIILIAIIVLHTVYFKRIQLGTRIFIFVLVSIIIFELLSLVNMIVAPLPSTGSNGCIALGILMQLAIVLLFIWMFLLIISLWLNLMGLTNGKEPLIAYIFIGLGLAVAIVVATILIGLYGLSWQLTELFGKVGEFCFIPSAAVAGVSTAIPIIIMLLIIVGILSHSCFYWSRWEDIQSLYKDTYNKRDIPLLLFFMILIITMILFGALHLYLQQIYLFFIFFGLNVVMGLYALIVYFFLSFHTLTWKHKHYPIKEEVEPLSIPEEPEFFNDSIDMYSSQQSLIPRTSTKNQLEPPPIQMVPLKTSSPQHDTAPTTTVSSQSSFVKPSLPRSIKRKQKSRHDSSLMESPLVEVIKEEKEGDSDSEQSGAYNVGVESEGEESGSHMDNLMFAIKTGVTYSDRDEDEEPVGLLRSPPQSSSSEQYRLRRISIADTHL